MRKKAKGRQAQQPVPERTDQPAAASADPAPEGGVIGDELPGFEDEDTARGAGEQGPGAALAEPLEQAVLRLEREVAQWRDRALRAAADLDNYRKRAIREREETFGRGQAEVLGRIIEVIDDLARVAHLDPQQTTAQALHEGMLQIERKFLKVLEAAGVERIDPLDERFDPNAHEAVTTVPASSPEADHTVGMVLQHGYRLRGALLRPARVAVRLWGAPQADVPAEGAGEGTGEGTA